MSDCIFCKIVSGDIPADIVYQDDDVVVFRDLGPQAPEHVLLIPRKHIAGLNDLTEADQTLVGKMHLTAAKVAADLGIAEGGYRTVVNCNSDGGQTVFHLHMHLLGGRQMNWPPG
ncbi:MAG: histidine triad nucleotide-binding protein [bacterium]